MTTKGFSGGAGTGKTTSLLRELDDYLVSKPLKPGQRVLALTFMHGSRRRLSDRLAKSKARRRFECMTLDRFAWEICRRWRSRLRVAGCFLPLDLGTAGAAEFDAVCEAAGRLLSAPDVAGWVAARFPVVILDEFQDCAAVRVAIAQAMHGKARLFIAADDFQNLNLSEESPAVTWLRGLGSCQELTLNHRTSDTDLLNAAQALRDGRPLVAGNSTSFMIRGVPKADIAASYISKTIWPASGKQVVLLSPAKPASSPWIRKITELVGKNKYGDKKDIGPVTIHWDASPESVEETALAELDIASGEALIDAKAIQGLSLRPLASRLRRWAEYQRRVLGQTTFSAKVLRTQVRGALHQIRAFGSAQAASRRAMTIHQAKNQEFSVVIILWPFEVKGDPVRLRRLLYNAVTRAKRRAVIIVNDPKKNRLNLPPFVGSETPAAPVASTAPTTPLSTKLREMPAPGKKLYFAYGSNMWEEQMKKRCPQSEKVGGAMLEGYRWIITTRGVANVVLAADRTVEGTLFWISQSDEESLDKYERVAQGAYRKENLPVQYAGERHVALVYVDPITQQGPPNKEYISRINKGVKDAQLSAEYIRSQIRPIIPIAVSDS